MIMARRRISPVKTLPAQKSVADKMDAVNKKWTSPVTSKINEPIES